MQSTRLHIAALTSVRGLAACWVVAFHFWSDVLILFPAAEVLSPFVRNGIYAVPLFFILSGYVISANYLGYVQSLTLQKYLRFMGKRLRRIYPVHLVTLLAVLLMFLAAKRAHLHLDPTGYRLDTFVANVFLVHSWMPNFMLSWNFPSWSISSEFFAYLCFPFLAFPLQKYLRLPWQNLALVIVCCVATMAAYTRYGGPLFELVVVIPTFLGGMAIYRWLDGLDSPPLDRIWLSYLLVLGVVAAPYLLPWLTATRAMMALFFALIVVLAASGPVQSLWSRPAMVYLGEISYSLYMSHTIAQKLLHGLLPVERFGQASPLLRLAVLMAYLLLICGATLACYYLVETRFHKPRSAVGARLQGLAA